MVSRETQALLGAYLTLVRKWSPAINLVSRNDLPLLDKRHLADCEQLAALADPAPDHWADLGSGGGFPGIVAAIILRDQPTRFTLIESDRRKAAFLATVARELALPRLRVIPDRIEAEAPLGADLVSARALAPLPALMAYVHRHVAAGGRALLMKGAAWQQEVDAARAAWTFTLDATESRTQSGAVILDVRNLAAR